MPPGRVLVSWLDPLVQTRPMLAMSLQAAWYWGDAPLRAALETSIRSLVQRSPELLPVLKASTRIYRPPAHAWLNGTSELAGLLLTLWILGDVLLRDEVEVMIRAYAQRHPTVFVPSLKALTRAALDDGRVVGTLDQREPTIRQLRALLSQLEG